MKCRNLVSTLLLCSTFSVHPSVAAETKETLPNIVLILADDLGYGDAGSFNPQSKVPTPNLDRLAREGMRFTNAYSPDAVCTPSRYALWTGRYSWRTTLRRSVQLNWEKPLINEGRMTVPLLLKQAGYRTAGFGKWHLGADFPTIDGLPPVGQGGQRHELDGANLDLEKPMQGGPMARGFDRWFGFICASESFVYDDLFATAYIDVYPRPKAKGAEALRHIPLAKYLPELTEKAVDYINMNASSARAGKPFFLHFSPYVPHIPLALSEEFKGKTKAGDYGDYVHQLDHEVGRLLDALDQQGLTDNTLVIFLSDNGSHFEVTGEGHRPNGQLKGTKATIHEAGVRVPLIARWPERIGAGAISSELVASADLLATMSSLVQMPLPNEAGEDSFDIMPILVGQPGVRTTREFVIVKSAAAHLAIRQGRWKFIAPLSYPWSKDAALGNDNTFLYDLEADPGETSNRVADNPSIAEAMRQKLVLSVDSAGTIPGLMK
jgi:arylsulfatase A